MKSESPIAATRVSGFFGSSSGFLVFAELAAGVGSGVGAGTAVATPIETGPGMSPWAGSADTGFFWSDKDASDFSAQLRGPVCTNVWPERFCGEVSACNARTSGYAVMNPKLFVIACAG